MTIYNCLLGCLTSDGCTSNMRMVSDKLGKTHGRRWEYWFVGKIWKRGKGENGQKCALLFKKVTFLPPKQELEKESTFQNDIIAFLLYGQTRGSVAAVSCVCDLPQRVVQWEVFSNRKRNSASVSLGASWQSQTFSLRPRLALITVWVG